MIIAEYEPRARKWIVTNGAEIARFPAGNLGKHQAQLYALNQDRPDLAALIYKTVGRNYGSRAINMALKAAYILIDGLLYINGVVESQSRPGVFHTITFSGQPKTYGCTCEAMRFCAIYIDDVGWLCKHSLAAHMAYLLNLELPQQPIPEKDPPPSLPECEFNSLQYFGDEF